MSSCTRRVSALSRLGRAHLLLVSSRLVGVGGVRAAASSTANSRSLSNSLARPRDDPSSLKPGEQELGPEQVWEEVSDQATGQKYWWCQETDETTHVGAPRPKSWREVTVLDEGSGKEVSYWWCEASNETTAVGAPRPRAGDTAVAAPAHPFPVTPLTAAQRAQVAAMRQAQQQGQPVSFASSLGNAFIWGVGMATAFAIIGRMLVAYVKALSMA
eukprot:g44602.t1